jgi:hypothetical protein
MLRVLGGNTSLKMKTLFNFFNLKLLLSAAGLPSHHHHDQAMIDGTADEVFVQMGINGAASPT